MDGKIKKLLRNPLLYLAIALFSVITHNVIYRLMGIDEPVFLTAFFASGFVFIFFSVWEAFVIFKKKFCK